jgi:hypothetical protein
MPRSLNLWCGPHFSVLTLLRGPRWKVDFRMCVDRHVYLNIVYISLHDNVKHVLRESIVRYHSGGSMKLNACNLLLAHMVY